MTGLQNRTVMIIDDDSDVRVSLRRFLVDAGYKVLNEAPNGYEGLQKCRNHNPDVVFLDIQMPVLDGIKTAKHITEENLTKCIIMLTAFDDRKYVDDAINAGAMGYLLKPIDFDSVIPTIELCLEKSKECYLLNKSIHNLKRKKEQSAVVDKAKILIMEKKGVTESAAYEFLREMSKKKQASIEQVASYLVAKYL